MMHFTNAAGSHFVRLPALIVVVFFGGWMAWSVYGSWRRLRTLRRRRLEEAYDIARLVFGLITAGLIVWLLVTPPPHELTRGLLAALSVWACAYLGLFGFLVFLIAKRRVRARRR